MWFAVCVGFVMCWVRVSMGFLMCVCVGFVMSVCVHLCVFIVWLYVCVWGVVSNAWLCLFGLFVTFVCVYVGMGQVLLDFPVSCGLK